MLLVFAKSTRQQQSREGEGLLCRTAKLSKNLESDPSTEFKTTLLVGTHTIMNQLIQLILEEASRQLNVTVDGTTDDLTDPVDDNFQANKDLGSNNPTQAPTATDAPLNKQEVVGFVVLAIAVALLCIGVYLCYSCWKQQQERRFMNYVNTRADSVLGDMVMVPTSFNEDDDEDRVESDLI